MGNRISRNAIVAAPFTLDAGYTAPLKGDPVKLSGDYEVALVGAGELSIGIVSSVLDATDSQDIRVVVELRGVAIRQRIASAAIAIGEQVVEAGTKKIKARAAEDARLVTGTALQIAAADLDLVDVLEAI